MRKVAGMSERAEVTTIIRTYNRRDQTLAAVRSVIDQSIADQPIVVVDDGSTDGVAEAVASHYGDRVKLVRHETNRGVGAAANSGLASVTTPFAAFLDSDDVWEPEFLRTMLSALKSVSGTTLAYCNFWLEFPEHDLDYAVRAKEPEALPERLMTPPFTMSSVMVRTRSARAIGPFTEEKTIGEDSDFYTRLWLRAPESFVHVQENLLRHRIWTGNTTMDLNRLIREMDTLTKLYLRHPYFAHLRDSYNEIVRQRLLGVAARHQVYKWLAAVPKRPLSLIITGIDDVADLEKSLESATRQRLPPSEVAVVVEKTLKESLAKTTERDWPFRLHIVTVRPGLGTGEQLQYAINVLTGSAVIFLQAGEEFTEDALDAHRHALSCSPQSVLMSYGGMNDQTPAALPGDRSSVAYQLITDNTICSLSTVAISRKALISARAIPRNRKDGFCLNLLLNLLGKPGPIVRIQRPVVVTSEQEDIDLETVRSVLRDVSESDTGHHLIGTLDQALDDLCWQRQHQSIEDCEAS